MLVFITLYCFQSTLYKPQQFLLSESLWIYKMDACGNSSFSSQWYLYPFSSNLGPTPLLQEAANPALGRAATQRAPGRLGEQTNRNFMKFNTGKCEALHPGRKSKTSWTPSGWGVAVWRSPWGPPSLPNLLSVPRQWALLTTLGFPSHPSLRARTHPSGFWAHEPRHPGLGKGCCTHSSCWTSPSSGQGFAATPAPESLMAVLPTLAL